MFHFFQHLATKALGVVASAIIAVGIVKMPPTPPVVEQNHSTAPTAQTGNPDFNLFTNSTTIPSSVIKKKNTVLATPVNNISLVQQALPQTTPPATVCNNVSGGSLPAGWFSDGQGNCSPISPGQQAQQNAAAQQQMAQQQVKAQQAQQQAEQEAQQQAQQKAAVLQAKLAQQQTLLTEMENECENSITAFEQQIVNIKAQYFADLSKGPCNNTVCSTGMVDVYDTKILNDANTKIQTIDNQISQAQLTCSAKYGNALPTALCNDGTFSYSQDNSGTCSDHSGVNEWFK